MEVVALHGGVKIYNVSSGKSLPQWLSETKKKKAELKKDEEFRRRVELLQDFEMPIATQRIKASRDGRFVAATGTYKPQIRMYELEQLSMKFERHLDCEVVDFQILSDDYSKIVYILADRTVEFHAQFGNYYKTRVPKMPRDLMYHSESCDLYVCGSSSEIYRLNLDQGRFLAPLNSSCPAINVCGYDPVHSLLAFGGEDGVLECWDPRVKNCIGKRDVGQLISDGPNETVEISSLRFAGDGLRLATGTSSGHCLLFDLRAGRPTLVKDHQYGLPLVDIKFHSSGNVISADKKIVKLWNKDDGKLFTSIEPPGDINDVCVYGDSGMIFVAGEQPRIQTYYIPALGTAPKWCSWLDSLTDELEEDKQETVYDDFKFVTREELERLGVARMIGTPYLRAYMHGFFMDMRLYRKVREIADPFAYEQYRKERIAKKLEEQISTRISVPKKKPKVAVNQTMAERFAADSFRLKEKERAEEYAAQSQSQIPLLNPLEDPRFSALFSDPKFVVDEDSQEFQRIFTAQKKKKKEDDDEEDFALVDQEEEADPEEDQEEESEPDEKRSKRERNNGKKGPRIGEKRKRVALYETKKDGLLGKLSKKSLGDLVRQRGDRSTASSSSIVSRPGGFREITWTPSAPPSRQSKSGGRGRGRGRGGGGTERRESQTRKRK